MFLITRLIYCHLSIYIGSGNHCDTFCINNDPIITMSKNEKVSECRLSEINILQYLNGKISIDISNSL